ncbi:hypothetical protein NQ318_012714 [Aromia moschata]|uniref:Uncharacterized protein n=1 Tax=Aromia moschata TaxID=1265417 RepID=A0AAV8Y0M4_9CUCU|nr:hypothetical protein NQ318_012714 [Aromia moschata]
MVIGRELNAKLFACFEKRILTCHNQIKVPLVKLRHNIERWVMSGKYQDHFSLMTLLMEQDTCVYSSTN